MATDKKKDAIFRMEEKDGKLYRVMYFKNNRGGLTRSKFIREVKRKKPGRPKKSTRTTKNAKMINENRAQINNNTRKLNQGTSRSTTRVPQSTVPQRVQGRMAPQRGKKPIRRLIKKIEKEGIAHQHLNTIGQSSKFQRPKSNKYVQRSGSAQEQINKWKRIAQK